MDEKKGRTSKLQKAHTWTWLTNRAVNSARVSFLKALGYGKCCLVEINYISMGQPARKFILCHNRGDIVRIEPYFKGVEAICN